MLVAMTAATCRVGLLGEVMWKRQWLWGRGQLGFTPHAFEARTFPTIDRAWELRRYWFNVRHMGWRLPPDPQWSIWQIMDHGPHVLLVERCDGFAPGGAPNWHDPAMPC